jgi:hypothetical protein
MTFIHIFLYYIQLYKKNKIYRIFKYIDNIENMSKILYLDIDNTLLQPNNIFIYYRNGDIELKYTPDEYAKIDVSIDEKQYYDYGDFNNPDKIMNSIYSSIPLYHNLRIIEKYVSEGWELGILTARGVENVINDIIPLWLKQHLKIGFILKRENIFAVNDKTLNYEGYTDSLKKVNVLKKIYKSKKYKKIGLFDDNEHTLELLRNMFKTKIELIHATPN